MKANYSYQGAEALENFARVLKQYSKMLELYGNNFKSKVGAMEMLGEFYDDILDNANIVINALGIAREQFDEVADDCEGLAGRIVDNLNNNPDGDDQKVMKRR